MKKSKGITLIALVITVVILIILAGVAVNLTVGENGIFSKAKYAREQYANEQAREETEIAKTTNEIDSYVSGSRAGNVEQFILWENPNDTTIAFAAQTITLLRGDYDYLEVVVRYHTLEPDFFIQKMYKGYSFALMTASGYSNLVAKRNIIFVDEQTLNISVGYFGSSTVNNLICVPEKIIGFKYK